MRFLHDEVKIVHLDMSSRNVMLCNTGSNVYEARLLDFGFGQILDFTGRHL